MRCALASKLAKHSDFIGNGPVQYQLNGPIDAPTGVQVRIDYADAPIPRDYYVADYFFVENRDPDVLFVFGKLAAKGNLRTRLEIVFPAGFFINQLLASSREFHAKLREYVDKLAYHAQQPGDHSLEADKEQTLVSNNVLMVLSAGDSLMDFYYISPRDMYYKPRNRRDIELEPLARVLLNPPMLLGFLDECERISPPLKRKFTELENEQKVESN